MTYYVRLKENFQKDAFVLPKHRFCALQKTPSEEELEKDSNSLPGHQPYNQVDDVCRAHDWAYSKAKNKADKHKADSEMLANPMKLKPKNFREKVDKAITRTIIVAKYPLGLSINQKQIFEDLFKLYMLTKEQREILNKLHYNPKTGYTEIDALKKKISNSS